MILRFIGLESDVAGTTLKRFGQALTVSDEVAFDLIYGDNATCPVLPDEEFQKIPFTSQELEQNQYPGLHGEAPAPFLEKKRMAIMRLHEMRTEGPPVQNPDDHQEVA